jgi:hypothetical protein
MSTSILLFKTPHLFVEDRFCSATWALDTLKEFVDALFNI